MPLKVSDGIGAWIKDFQKSDAPQFKGKNKEERRDMAVAAYLTAKRGPEKENVAHDEAMDAKRKAEMDRAMAAFKKRGGKIKKLAPAKAQGYHGKDDPGKGMAGMLDRPDTKKSFMGTRKKVGSMRESVIWESMDPKMRKVRQLATLGLVGKSDVNKLMQAMKSIGDGKEVKPQHRKIIFDAFADLIDLVTGDTQVFQKAKKSVKEDVNENLMLKNPYKDKRYSKSDLKRKQQSFQRQLADLQNKRMRSKMGSGGGGYDQEIDRMQMKLKQVMQAMKEEYQYGMGTPEATKHAKKVTPGYKEDKDENEYDKEGEMLKDHLDIIMDAADEMYDTIDDDENLPEWVQSKVTKAADYIDTARDYMMSQKTDKDNRVDEKKLMKGIEVDDDTLRMFKANPRMVPNSPAFRRLDPKTQKAVKKHLGMR